MTVCELTAPVEATHALIWTVYDSNNDDPYNGRSKKSKKNRTDNIRLPNLDVGHAVDWDSPGAGFPTVPLLIPIPLAQNLRFRDLWLGEFDPRAVQHCQSHLVGLLLRQHLSRCQFLNRPVVTRRQETHGHH